MRSAFVSPSFLVSDSSGGSRVCVCVTGMITPPPLNFPDTENLCKVCVAGTDHPPPPWNVDDATRAMSKGGGVLVNVQEWGCFSIFRRADDVTRTMSKGGGVLVNVFTPPLQEILYPRLDLDRDPLKSFTLFRPLTAGEHT